MTRQHPATRNGPRGAAAREDFLRQQAKIVTAINTLDADIVSLEEIENSVAVRRSRPRRRRLEAGRRAERRRRAAPAGPSSPSPAAADLPTLAEQDVIRTAFIYDPSTVALVGASKVLVGDAAFGNAREPLAQAFKAKGTRDADAFGVIVNHFKSKGSGTDDGPRSGQRQRRTGSRQATRWPTSPTTSRPTRGITKMFLTGDFNAYSEEDPIQVLEAPGYTNLESDTAGEESYSFSGLVGFARPRLRQRGGPGRRRRASTSGTSTPASRSPTSTAGYNYNVTDFFDGTTPFRASDHNPEIVGHQRRGRPERPGTCSSSASTTSTAASTPTP